MKHYFRNIWEKNHDRTPTTLNQTAFGSDLRCAEELTEDTPQIERQPWFLMMSQRVMMKSLMKRAPALGLVLVKQPVTVVV
jgi:hypothetical protein